ncbi:hypothetical protein LTR65_000434 [Meristemomyces frigidus]
MAIVIDISSDSEPDESPNKAARSALQNFEPRKERTTLNGRHGSAQVRDSEHQEHAKLGSAHVRRKISTQGGAHERRQSQGPPTQKALFAAAPLAPHLQHIASIQPKRDHEQDVYGGVIGGSSRLHLHNDARLGQSDRVRKFNDFHAKEALRRESAPVFRKKTTTGGDEGGGGYEKGPSKRLESAHSANKPGSNTSNRAVLSGAGLAIIDLPAPPADVRVDAARHRKRPASPPHMLGPTAPSPKRQRIAETPRLREIQRPTDPEQHKSAHRRLDDSAKESSQQLEDELAASLPPNSPKGPPRQRADTRPQKQPKHAAAFPPPVASQQSAASKTSHGMLFTPADDALLAQLKEVDNLGWDVVHAYFPTRSRAAIQVRYSTKVKGKALAAVQQFKQSMIPKQPQLPPPPPPPLAATSKTLQHPTGNGDYQAPARRKKRGGGASVLDGFVFWSQVKHVLDDPEPERADNAATSFVIETGPVAREDRIYPSSMSRLLRQRELGGNGGRGSRALRRCVAEEMKNHVLSEYRLNKHYENTCGDVTCLAWATDGERFVAGSIAISDDRSMQYNSGRNLLIGDSKSAMLQELPEHHIPRPVIDGGSGNVNGEHAMRESQDARLFMTVAAVAFSPNGKRIYSAGSDKKVRMYRVGGDIHEAKCRYEIDHPAAVDLLTVSSDGLLATACHSGEDGSVRVYACKQKTYDLKLSLSPSRTDAQSPLPLFPSALKWGVAAQHSKFLLAGFSSDSVDDARDTAGETALWNVEIGYRIPLSTVTRNVFDVAWNPSPSSSSTSFAVASTPGTGKSSRGKRSVVQLYAPGQDGARQVIEWECPAFDINDVLYCPYDDNLIAAGATDGKVYIWDKRFASRSQSPLHVLAHEESVNVLDHRFDKESTDTGIRFLSWGATASRLYSGSSDGIVKVWNPYRSPGNALVKDAATFKTAIMSGAFSHDYRDLLVGEECGRINLLSIGSEGDGDNEDGCCRLSSTFRLRSAPEPAKPTTSPFAPARELVQSKQIELRPMGAIPIRQAVQGPAYDGPYLIPSNKQWTEAQSAYGQALDAQNAAHTQLDVPSSQASVAETTTRDADNRVKAAQAALERLQSRHDESVGLELVSGGNQSALRAAEKGRMQLEALISHPAERCQLDCNYLPKELDITAGVPDTLRSEQRIPAALRALPNQRLEITDLDCEGLYNAGLAGRCLVRDAAAKKQPSGGRLSSVEENQELIHYHSRWVT